MTIIFSQSNSPTFNLAAEEYLFSTRTDDVLFLYVNEPSAIIGSHQIIQNEVDLSFCKKNHILIVRRMSGGGAVYHDLGNLNFCFISNKSEGKSILNGDFLLPIIDILSLFGIPVVMGKRMDLWLQEQYKITGTASHVSKNRVLQHGTLLYDTDLEKLQKTLTVKEKNNNLKGIASVPSRVNNIRTYLTEKDSNTVISNDFFQKFVLKTLELFEVDSLSTFIEDEIILIKQLQKTKYETDVWTFKK